MVVISNPSVAPSSGSLTDYYTISCEFDTTPDYAFVTVGEATKAMEISGTIGLVRIHGSIIGILSAGTITIVGTVGADADDDTSLTLTISDTEDKTNLIRDTVAEELRTKTASGQWFQNFTIYEHPQISTGWSTPCIEMEMLREPTTPYLLGTERLETITMMFYLIFKRSQKRTISGTLKEMDELSNWYLERLKDTLNEITWPSSINIDSVEIIGNTHKEPDSIEKLFLYGCEVHMIIRYKGGIT